MKPNALASPFSDRELAVLELLVAGQTNQQIADTLIVAVDTVKKHTSTIYGKLGVENRTQAIRRTRAPNLIQ